MQWGESLFCYKLFTSTQRRRRLRRFAGLAATALAGAALEVPLDRDAGLLPLAVLFFANDFFFENAFLFERSGRLPSFEFLRGPLACRAASLRRAAAFWTSLAVGAFAGQ